MNIGRGTAVHRHLGQLFEGQSVAGLGEVQLLERFVERRDEPAFAALVARHGPMVLGVCRRILADPLDVEDAFQATFLVLVRRAGSLRDRDRLAPWLFGVARKVATRARADLARRRDREKSGFEEIAAISRLDDPTRELGRALFEEIDRLPGSLREPILLCCVEGLSYDEAAAQLRSTAPAIRGRLARARGRLKDRLTRRGFAPTVGTLGVLLSAEVVSAAVPLRLLKTTIQVAKAGAVPAGVEFLAEGVIRTMILTKSKILAAAVVACGVAGSSMGVSAQFGGEAQRNKVEAERLDQVEKKLDRVLDALEGRHVAPPARFTSVVPQPPATPAPATVTSGVHSYDIVPDVPGQSRTTTTVRGVLANDRLEKLEHKLQSLEERILKLERKFSSDTVDPSSTAPRVDPSGTVPRP
jgi:RNA polymerase sigma factor (sigma-70 family)